jgi:hypothetical protein
LTDFSAAPGPSAMNCDAPGETQAVLTLSVFALMPSMTPLNDSATPRQWSISACTLDGSWAMIRW